MHKNRSQTSWNLASTCIEHLPFSFDLDLPLSLIHSLYTPPPITRDSLAALYCWSVKFWRNEFGLQKGRKSLAQESKSITDEDCRRNRISRDVWLSRREMHRSNLPEAAELALCRSYITQWSYPLKNEWMNCCQVLAFCGCACSFNDYTMESVARSRQVGDDVQLSS